MWRRLTLHDIKTQILPLETWIIILPDPDTPVSTTELNKSIVEALKEQIGLFFAFLQKGQKNGPGAKVTFRLLIQLHIKQPLAAFTAFTFEGLQEKPAHHSFRKPFNSRALF